MLFGIFPPSVVLWVMVLIVLIVIEIATINLVTIWFAVGALAATISCAFTDYFWVQFLVFTLISAIALVASKPFIDKARNKKPPSDVGLVRNVGRTATVLQAISPAQSGRVRLDGVDWTATSTETLAEGMLVVVTEVDATTLRVASATATA